MANEPGLGSVFTLILPLVHPGRNVSSVVNPTHGAFSYSSAANQPHDKQNNSGKTILIIEDSEPAIIHLSEILKDQGYNYEIVRDGNEVPKPFLGSR